MTPLVPIVMFGWIPVALLIFSKYPVRRAMVIALIAGWLFLPEAAYAFHGFPNYTKLSALSLGLLLGAFLFDGVRLTRGRPRWVDLPIIVWCLVPLPSSIAVGLGVYAGIAAVVNQTLVWGVPWLLGRKYFGDLAGAKDLAVGIFAGGIAYVPLCLYEIRMSPMLSYDLYGFTPGQWAQEHRFGGWRPVVFMQHGLEVGMWMAGASLLGFWLWRSGTLKKLWSMPMRWLVPVLIVTTVLGKSTGAIALLAIGLGMLWVGKHMRWTWLLGLLVALVPVYMVARTTDLLSTQRVMVGIKEVFPESRALSLEMRLKEEDVLTKKAMERPWLGWGPWGGFRTGARGQDIVKFTDGLWVIMFGKYGMVGLASLTLVFLLPGAMAWWRIGAGEWANPDYAAVVAMAFLVVLYMYDCLMNALPDPVFIVAAGAVGGAMYTRRQVRNRAVRVVQKDHPSYSHRRTVAPATDEEFS